MRGSISQSPFVSRAPYLSSWGANASDRCLPWPGYLSQKSFQCPVPSDCLRGQRVLSGSAPIKVIRVRIVALRFGVCAVTEDVSPSAPDIVPSGQSRPSSICKVLSPSKSAASPSGDVRIFLRVSRPLPEPEVVGSLVRIATLSSFESSDLDSSPLSQTLHAPSATPQ